ncbi:hypothetical protein BV22DRAFT_112477 [Leucogyrophana mollusca]|uniref:Uncharacterized protein n=1 Tax=Leucogyrophana mollusca TaxID=85980 RepID=A0ACB8BV72_9AGAM|nr:hypothetical protein BV22DRAFT_112477 [Leucogyrophana mollusca]
MLCVPHAFLGYRAPRHSAGKGRGIKNCARISFDDCSPSPLSFVVQLISFGRLIRALFCLIVYHFLTRPPVSVTHLVLPSTLCIAISDGHPDRPHAFFHPSSSSTDSSAVLPLPRILPYLSLSILHLTSCVSINRTPIRNPFKASCSLMRYSHFLTIQSSQNHTHESPWQSSSPKPTRAATNPGPYHDGLLVCDVVSRRTPTTRSFPFLST